MSKKSGTKKKEAAPLKPREITKAEIKDDFCNYNFKINVGTEAGFTHNVKGIGIVDHDMKIAFSRFTPHLAFMDGGFGDTEISNIDSFIDHEVTARYRVDGFEMKGSAESPSIVLKGSKFLPKLQAYMDIKTPKISLERKAFYQFYNELREAAEVAVKEVEEYMNGKFTAKDTSTVDENQLAIPEADLEDAKV